MSKRDLIAEILAKKLRRQQCSGEAIWRLHDLEMSFSELEKQGHANPATFSLYLVGIASCIEVAVRDTICQLIDYGQPYIDRVPDLLKNDIRFNLDIVRALTDRKITFGDFVSHLVSINGVESINDCLNTLLGCKLRVALANVCEFVEPPESFWLGTEEEDESVTEKRLGETAFPPRVLVPDVEGLMASIAELFKARHIAAHEADFGAVTLADLHKYFDSAQLFANALGEYVDQTLNPNSSRTAFGSSVLAAIKSGEIYTSMENAFEELESLIRSDYSDNSTQAIEALAQAQNTFLQYLEAEQGFFVALYSPTSGNSIRHIEAQVQHTLAKQRKERLREIIDEFSIQ